MLRWGDFHLEISCADSVNSVFSGQFSKPPSELYIKCHSFFVGKTICGCEDCQENGLIQSAAAPRVYHIYVFTILPNSSIVSNPTIKITGKKYALK